LWLNLIGPDWYYIHSPFQSKYCEDYPYFTQEPLVRIKITTPCVLPLHLQSIRKEADTVVFPTDTTPETPRSARSPILSPIEAARSGDLMASISLPPIVKTDKFGPTSLANLLPATTFGQLSPSTSPMDANIAASDIFCSRSYSLPQMKILSSSSPSPLLSDSTEDVKAGLHCCLGIKRRLNRKCISTEDLDVFDPCPELSILADSPAKLPVSLESSSTIPMVATSCSPTSSVDTLDSERTLPMRLDTTDGHLHCCACHKHSSLPTRCLKMAKTVDSPVWSECQLLEPQAKQVTYLHIEAKPVVGEPLHCCQVDECQVYTASLVPQTPYSTDSLSSTSPPFVFHNNTSISPAVEIPSISTTTVAVQQNPHPPSPVFPARPLSPVQPPPHPPPDNVNGSNGSTQSPFVYSSYTPPHPCCPMYVPGVAWMTTPHHFSSAFVPPPAHPTPAFFDPTTGAPIFACCLPPQPTPPPPPSQVQQVPLQTFLPQPDQTLLYPPPAPPSALTPQQQAFTSQMGYASPQPLPILEHQNQQQQQQQQQQQPFQQLQPQLPLMMDATEWVLGATPSAYPLHG
uniref:BAH domain-containing protein n=1 Tax=Hydatigena taeniaeformis TaxID=6205 RepID=A0A0R3WP38_HYDTA